MKSLNLIFLSYLVVASSFLFAHRAEGAGERRGNDHQFNENHHPNYHSNYHANEYNNVRHDGFYGGGYNNNQQQQPNVIVVPEQNPTTENPSDGNY